MSSPSSLLQAIVRNDHDNITSILSSKLENEIFDSPINVSGETLLMKCCFHNLNPESFLFFLDFLSSSNLLEKEIEKKNDSGSNFFLYFCTGNLNDATFKIVLHKLKSSLPPSKFKEQLEFTNVQ